MSSNQQQLFVKNLDGELVQKTVDGLEPVQLKFGRQQVFRGGADMRGDVVDDRGTIFDYSEQSLGAGADIGANVHHALKQNGGTGDVMLQNAIDKASSGKGVGVVIVTGAPDDLSGFTDADRTDGWLISSSVQHKDGVYIYCEGNTYFFLDNQVNSPFIENADHSNGNSNLRLKGGIWDGNKTNNNVRNQPENGYFLYYPVDKFKFDVNEVRSFGPNGYAVQVGDGKDWEFGKIKFDGEKDGVHLHGPCENIYVEHIYGNTGDDMMVLATADFPETEITAGDISNVTIGTVRKSSTDRVGDQVSLHGSSQFLIKDVTVHEVVGEDNAPAFKFRTLSKHDTGDGLVRTEGVTVETLRQKGDSSGGAMMAIGGDQHTSINIGEIDINGAGGNLVACSVPVDNLHIGSVIMKGAGPNRAIRLNDGGDIKSLVISSVSAYGFDNTFLRVDSGAILDVAIMENIMMVGPDGTGGSGTVDRLLQMLSNTKSTVYLNNVHLSHASRFAEINGDVDIILNDGEYLNGSNVEYNISDDAITLRLFYSNYRRDQTATMISGSPTLRVDGRDIQVNASQVTTAAKGDVYYNIEDNKGTKGEVLGKGVVKSVDGSLNFTPEHVATEAVNAEEPQDTYGPGTKVDFTDQGDGSGDGLYIIDTNGNPQGPL